jgi:hypothetical protein
MTKCPICKSAAEEIEPDFFDGKTFRCRKHNEFAVTDSALRTHVNDTVDQWEAAFKRAKDHVAVGARPRISHYSF